jgi:hypothetical protein
MLIANFVPNMDFGSGAEDHLTSFSWCSRSALVNQALSGISLPSRGTDEIRLTGKQAFSRRQPDKILRRFDLPFEMFVLSADMRNSLLGRVGLAVANESGVGGLDSMKEKGHRLLERFSSASRDRAANH